ncbi:MAG: hypothetical protein HY422_01455 [Candidatus Komeilibacteria bacterium]|nr:hypothetical protein [Candidatus Komeilibacteria bacterium]
MFARFVVVVVVALSMNVGCVKTTRVVLDKEGKPTEEVTTWEPFSVPVIYGGPVVYADAYYPPPVVPYERPYYYRSRVYYGHPVRTFYIGGRPNHHHHHYRHRR